LVAGERRWRASREAGLETIPALVEELDDDTALEISIIENLQREDLNPLEEATMFDRMAPRIEPDSMRVTARLSDASAMTVAGVPAIMSTDPVGVFSVSVGPTPSATGRITSAAVPTLPALSMADACSVTLSPGFALAGTWNVNDVNASGWAGSSVRESFAAAVENPQ